MAMTQPWWTDPVQRHGNTYRRLALRGSSHERRHLLDWCQENLARGWFAEIMPPMPDGLILMMVYIPEAHGEDHVLVELTWT